MDERIKKWFIKADNDLKVAIDEIVTTAPATDIVCFHCQQCIEKYLKGFLSYYGVEFKKTHNLEELIRLCIQIDKDFQKFIEMNIQEMTIYATELRYPDYFYMPTLEEAKDAVEKAKFVKEFINKKIGLNQ